MGHQRATLTTDNASISLSVYQEDADEIDYERVVAQVELETPDGKSYSKRKELTDTDNSVLSTLHEFLTSSTATTRLVEDVLEDVVESAEEDLEKPLNLQTHEIVHEFEQNVKQAT